MQLKFRNADDFHQLVAAIRRYALPITDSVVPLHPHLRPSTASDVVGRPAQSTSVFVQSTADHPPRASSVQHSRLEELKRSHDGSVMHASTNMLPPTRPNSGNSITIEKGSFLGSDSSFRRSSTSPATSILTSTFSHVHRLSDLPEPGEQTRSETLAPRDDNSSSFTSGRYDAAYGYNGTDSQSWVPEVAGSTSEESTRLARRSTIISAGHSQSQSQLDHGSFLDNSHTDTRKSKYISSTSLPSMTSHENNTSDGADHGHPAAILGIPPRRQLPFKKSVSQAVSVSDLPPLPRPASVNRDLTRVGRNQTSVPPNQAPDGIEISSTLQQACAKGSKSTLPDSTSSSTGLENIPAKPVEPVICADLAPVSREMEASPSTQALAVETAPKKTTKPKKRAPTAISRPAKRLKMVDSATQTQTSSGRDHTTAFRTDSGHLNTVENQTTLPDVTKAHESNAVAVESIDHETLPQRGIPAEFVHQLEEIITKSMYPAPSKDLWTRPRYVQADDDERSRMLNEFICESLENEDFIKLCEDMKGAWRRLELSR